MKIEVREKNSNLAVFARKAIQKDDIIEQVPVVVLTQKDIKLLSTTRLKNWFWHWKDNRTESAALTLGYGSFYNHNTRANAYFIRDFDGQNVYIYASKTIQENEEITINYLQKERTTTNPFPPEYLSNIDFLAIRKSPKKGRGVYAARDIKTGEEIEHCPVLFFSWDDYDNVEQTTLDDYFYCWDEQNKEDHCMVVMGYGSLFNHSNTPNIDRERDNTNKRFVFKAIKDIKAGEELLVKYFTVWFKVEE